MACFFEVCGKAAYHARRQRQNIPSQPIVARKQREQLRRKPCEQVKEWQVTRHSTRSLVSSVKKKACLHLHLLALSPIKETLKIKLVELR